HTMVECESNFGVITLIFFLDTLNIIMDFVSCASPVVLAKCLTTICITMQKKPMIPYSINQN
ncbi:MAG TPA: hypothetical protein VI522_07515, partial [Gammaproteobacteria bacterium]|nr:hypothetical protein [Gammaproteobacteria bacterium]